MTEDMSRYRQMSGDERRQYILNALRERSRPITGTELARNTGVSRQVIVQDVAVLRAAGHGVIATPQGYIRLPDQAGGLGMVSRPYRGVVATRHTRAQLEAELGIFIDHGIKVLDVIVEHPLYGELTGRLMLESHEDIQSFVERLDATQAQLLSSLTGGLHLHTLEAPSRAAFEAARASLAREGFLVDEALLSTH